MSPFDDFLASCAADAIAGDATVEDLAEAREQIRRAAIASLPERRDPELDWIERDAAQWEQARGGAR